MVDVVSWLSGLGPIAKKKMRLKGSHAFKLTVNEDRQEVLMYSKQYASQGEWQVSLFLHLSLYNGLFD